MRKGLALILVLLLALGNTLALAGGVPGEEELASAGEDDEVPVILVAAAVIVVGAVLLWILMRPESEEAAEETDTSQRIDRDESDSPAMSPQARPEEDRGSIEGESGSALGLDESETGVEPTLGMVDSTPWNSIASNL